MVDVKQFATELELEMDKKLDPAVTFMIKEAAKTALFFIFAEWPAHTFYSMANHHVSLHRPVESPTPEDRPSNVGAMQDEAAIKLHEGISFIEGLQPRKTRDIVIYISNPVHYAADVGFIEGNGEAIYERAAEQARMEITLGQ